MTQRELRRRLRTRGGGEHDRVRVTQGVEQVREGVRLVGVRRMLPLCRHWRSEIPEPRRRNDPVPVGEHTVCERQAHVEAAGGPMNRENRSAGAFVGDLKRSVGRVHEAALSSQPAVGGAHVPAIRRGDQRAQCPEGCADRQRRLHPALDSTAAACAIVVAHVSMSAQSR